MRKISRQVRRVGLASNDWSKSLYDAAGRPIQGGAGWIRFGQMASLMKHHLVIGRLHRFSNRMAVETYERYIHQNLSLMILQRNMEKDVPLMIKNSRSIGIPVINDVDDWFWGLHEENDAREAVDPKLNKESNIDHYQDSIKASNLVTVSTPFLAEQISQWNPNVCIIENCVQIEAFKRHHHVSKKPTIGWCGSTGHRSDDLKILIEPFKAMGTFVKFHHTGDIESQAPFYKKVKVSPLQVTTVPMLPPSLYPQGFTFDIGVVPLNDIPFNDAKSWIKGLEYAAAGIPFVASPSREYIRLYEEYGIGRLARTPEEWVHHFSELLDPKVREAESIRNREIVRAEFSVNRMAKAWDNIIWEVLNEA
jgi:glycosyltransferase involved in cell wall biosynthesis